MLLVVLEIFFLVIGSEDSIVSMVAFSGDTTLCYVGLKAMLTDDGVRCTEGDLMVDLDQSSSSIVEESYTRVLFLFGFASSCMWKTTSNS